MPNMIHQPLTILEKLTFQYFSNLNVAGRFRPMLFAQLAKLNGSSIPSASTSESPTRASEL